MNRRCSSHTVLTGSPGTIALTDPSDWVHMRIKTLSLPLFEFFLFSFLLALLLPTVSLTLTFSLRSLPLLVPLLYISPQLTVPYLPLSFCLSSNSLNVFTLFLSVGRCWVSTADQIMFPKHLLNCAALSPSVIRETTVTLVCPCPVELNWKLWSVCPPFCCFLFFF